MSIRCTPELGAVAAPHRFLDEIAAVLIQRIEAGAYPAGSKMPSTRELAEAFHVSTSIVREGVSGLKHDGYVEPRQGSGVYVLSRAASSRLRLIIVDSPDRGMLTDTYEMRLHVEQSCAELAAMRRSEEDIGALRAALDDMANAVCTRSDGTAADVRFHLAIAAATQNSAMRKLLEFLHTSLGESVKRARTNSNRTPDEPKIAQAEHEAIFAAIVTGDPLAAREAVRCHLESAAARLGLSIGSPSPSPPPSQRNPGSPA
jgi:GntR family transcriptional repressor for pyruvate dehydrogenase complex